MYGKTVFATYGLPAFSYTHTRSNASLRLQINTWILPGFGKVATYSIRPYAACLSDRLLVIVSKMASVSTLKRYLCLLLNCKCNIETCREYAHGPAGHKE